MNKRVLYYDLLRIIAIFGVIMIHVTAEHWNSYIDNNWLLNNFMNGIVHSWAVPIFVMISGALLLGKIDFTLKDLPRFLLRIILCL